jgi:hypothetical protein
MSKRNFAIGDIHGCNKTFTRLLATLAIERTDIVYLLGDLIDRGPDSKGVIDTVISLLASKDITAPPPSSVPVPVFVRTVAIKAPHLCPVRCGRCRGGRWIPAR